MLSVLDGEDTVESKEDRWILMGVIDQHYSTKEGHDVLMLNIINNPNPSIARVCNEENGKMML